MSKNIDRKLIEAVATLLCQKAATNSSFFEVLADTMEKKGYSLEAHQRGIHGTHVIIVKREP